MNGLAEGTGRQAPLILEGKIVSSPGCDKYCSYRIRPVKVIKNALGAELGTEINAARLNTLSQPKPGASYTLELALYQKGHPEYGFLLLRFSAGKEAVKNNAPQTQPRLQPAALNAPGQGFPEGTYTEPVEPAGHDARADSGGDPSHSVGQVGDRSYAHKELEEQLQHGSTAERRAAAVRLHELGANARGSIGPLIDTALYDGDAGVRMEAHLAAWGVGAGYDQAQYAEIFSKTMERIRKELESKSFKYKGSAIELVEMLMRRASPAAINAAFPEGAYEYLKRIPLNEDEAERADIALRVIRDYRQPKK